jgi:hypothetical protein
MPPNLKWKIAKFSLNSLSVKLFSGHWLFSSFKPLKGLTSSPFARGKGSGNWGEVENFNGD